MLVRLSAAAGLLGVGISIVAYLPQIIHLIREHCSAGISRMAFALWLVSSCLVTFHAVVIIDVVFIVLGAVQITTSLLIYIFSTKYRDGVCASHALAQTIRP
jgi:uncharacterized protein with PQ loop repeat